MLTYTDSVRIAILVDNYAITPSPVLAEWGLSMYVQVRADGKTYNILYDTGQTGIVVNNAEKLGLDLSKVTHIVISHGHYDHTGGLLKVLEKTGNDVHVIAHPEIFAKKLVIRGTLRYIGIPFSRKDLEDKCELILTRDIVQICPGTYFSGEILRYGYPEYTPDMYVAREDGRLIRDSMPDDAALIINVRDKGLVILTGCGHSGILNIIEYATSVTGVRKIYAVIGGLHQERESPDRIRELCQILKKKDIKLIMPLHCTGLRALHIFLSEIPERTIIGGAGSIIEI
ncbi:MAG: MBL fold metallo-hydrolase [Crenarchaeota archaeon]|nr:MBL fold metallo-hydrolase [Thermoproteota archaeon]